MGGCQNYGPFLGPYYNTAPNIQGTQKETIILTTTHIRFSEYGIGACKELEHPDLVGLGAYTTVPPK